SITTRPKTLSTQLTLLIVALFFARAGLVRLTRPLADFYTAGRLVPALLNSVAIASSSLAVIVFIGGAGALGPGWHGIILLLLGTSLGLVLAGLLIAPYLRGYGGYTLPDFLAERFGAGTLRPLAAFAIFACSFPALAAVVLAFGLLGEAAFDVPVRFGLAAGIVMVLVATLLGGMRSLSLSQIAYYVVTLLAGLIAIVTALWQTGSLMAAETLLIDEAVPALSWRPFEQTSPISGIALFACLTMGFASLPFLLMRGFTAPDAADARASFLGAPIFLLLLCGAAPAFAALYEAAFIAPDDALGMIAQAILVTGASAALLSCGAALALAMGNVLSHDFYFKICNPQASASRQLFAARISVLLVALCAGAGALMWPHATILGAAMALSLAASAFLPVLVLAIWSRRFGSDAAAAGMIAGIVVCLYYMVAPHTVPIWFYESSSFLSNASQADVAAYEALREAYYLAAGADARAALLTKWKAAALPMANWFGVHGALASVFAVPVGFAVAVITGLFTAASSHRRQTFVESLRRETGTA
ncbi:MAG: hypothetical protein AAF405_10130, partial [Pseudomonadota bacterium]